MWLSLPSLLTFSYSFNRVLDWFITITFKGYKITLNENHRVELDYLKEEKMVLFEITIFNAVDAPGWHQRPLTDIAGNEITGHNVRWPLNIYDQYGV